MTSAEWRLQSKLPLVGTNPQMTLCSIFIFEEILDLGLDVLFLKDNYLSPVSVFFSPGLPTLALFLKTK